MSKIKERVGKLRRERRGERRGPQVCREKKGIRKEREREGGEGAHIFFFKIEHDYTSFPFMLLKCVKSDMHYKIHNLKFNFLGVVFDICENEH